MARGTGGDFMKTEKTGLELLAQGASDLARALKKLENRAMRDNQVIDHLTYASYKHNRDISPEVPPARWVTIYGPNATAMEAQYQKDKSKTEG